LSGSGVGAQDIFIRKLSINLYDNPTGTWGTYYGGNGFDEAASIAVAVGGGSNDMFFCGTTNSDGLASTSAMLTTRQGGDDGFVTRMSDAGTRVWSTYYGSTGDDNCFALAVGYEGYVYMTGLTMSPDFFATPGAYQTDATSTYDQGNAFIAKLQPETGMRIWGSFYGGPGADYGRGIASRDNTNTLYIGGATESAGRVAKGKVHQRGYAGGGDLFLASFMQSDPCDQWFPDPTLTVASSEVFDGHAVVFTAAAHLGNTQYEYHFYYDGGNGNGQIDIEQTDTDGSHAYIFTDQNATHPAVGRHDVLVIMSGPNDCVREANFVVKVKPVLPLCETTFLVTTASSVKLDKFSGSYVIQLNRACAEDIALDCVYGKVDFPQTQNVVTASASTYSDNWSYAFLTTRPTTGNTYERGERGKWRTQATYAFNGGKVKVDKNYNSGTFVLPNFVWQRPDATHKAGWLKTSEVTRYSPNGEALEERNALNIASTAKFGYNEAMPYLIAQNADYNSVLFESFENAYGTVLEDGTPSAGGTLKSDSAHSGSYSFQLESRFSTRPFEYTADLIQKGMVVRFWAKGTNPAAAMKLVVHVSTSDQVVLQAPITYVARSGDWSLWQAKIAPNGFVLPADVNTFRVALQKTGIEPVRIDDLRVQPYDAEMTCYVYDPATLRVLTTLDDQHFGMFYQYNMEGKLVRKMIETERGIKTIQETQYNTPERDRTIN
jgi:hypothetical protein